jgi:hypothetical protein
LSNTRWPSIAEFRFFLPPALLQDPPFLNCQQVVVLSTSVIIK